MKSVAVAKSLILNEKNELLILHIGEHTERPERSYTPDLPGGLVDNGEPEKLAAIRELEEEASISLDPAQMALVHTLTAPRPQQNESFSFLIYLAKLDHTPDVKVSWEHESYEWVPIEEVATRLKMRPQHQAAIDYVLEQKLI